MGRAAVSVPEKLSVKLKQIRENLGLIQIDMANMLDTEQTFISGWERGTRVIPMPIVLRYARLYNVCTDYLLDDDLELPDEKPRKKLKCL